MKKINLKRPRKGIEEVPEIQSDYGTMSDSDADISEQPKISDKKKPKQSATRDKLKKLKSSKLTKQPTTEELNRLRETENLFNSNFFRLQIEEVLKEVNLKSKYVALFDDWLKKFNNFIDTLQDGPSSEISDQEWLSENYIKIPMIQEPFETKGFFKFVKCPPAVVIGSLKLGCILGPKIVVDLKIEMPKEMMNKNDYVNEKYHRKRALYLSYIASKLASSDIVENSTFSLLDGSNYKPILVIKPAGKLGKYVNINLHVTLEDGAFTLFRFSPSRNNVREDWRFELGDTVENNLSAATPMYNSAVLQDLTCDVNNMFLYANIAEKENIKHGILLLKIWLKQRHIHRFSGFILSMFVAHLVKIKRINNAMSSYQVIRNVWTALAASEWDKNGVSLFSSDPTAHHPVLSEFHTNFPVVFVDCSGFNNICAHTSLDLYNTVKYESQMAVEFLDSRYVNGFIPLFMTPVDYHLKYDNILRIEYTNKLENAVMKTVGDNIKLDCGADKYIIIQKYLCDLIRKGLGQRISLLTPKCLTAEELSWPVSITVKKGKALRKPFTFGIKLNPEYAYNFLDKGPQANLPEAERFREFWGEKSDLRRFQDGSISEACVWETDHTMTSKRLIVKQIINYLLKIKLGLENKMFYVADQFDFILHNRKLQPANFEYGTGEECAMRVSASFDNLTKDLRSLTDMPLEVHSIHGTCSVFSFSDPMPPLPYAPVTSKGIRYNQKYRLIRDVVSNDAADKLYCPLFIPALKVVVQLTHSGKWPDNINALRRIKAAFNVQIAEALVEKCNVTSQAWPNHVDVLKDGYVFRIEIAHWREINLLKETIDKDGITKYRDTDESLEVEYRLMHLPRLRIALNGLHHQNPAFGSAACLLKRWLNAHLIDSSHFPEICVDMLVASLFLRPEPYEVSNQPQTVFWRALTMLSKSDWNTQMVVLNFNEDLSKEDLAGIETRFNVERTSLPPLYFVTPYEGKKPSVWSRTAPSFQILARIQILAAESLKLLNEIIFNNLSNDVDALFSCNTEGFDILIQLNREFNPLNYLGCKMRSASDPRKNRAYEKTNDELFPVLDFNPVQMYLKELRSCYDEFALFFHDTYGGDFIAVLWKPPALEFKEFKTSHVNGRKMVTRNGKEGLIADLDSILEGFCILGEGLVKDIDNRSNLSL